MLSAHLSSLLHAYPPAIRAGPRHRLSVLPMRLALAVGTVFYMTSGLGAREHNLEEDLAPTSIPQTESVADTHQQKKVPLAKSPLDQAFAEAVKKTAEDVWGGDAWSKKFAACIGARATSITHKMKRAVVEKGLVNDAVFHGVPMADAESLEFVMSLCEKEGDLVTVDSGDEEAIPKPMSLKEAKKVTASLAKAGYVPPPRTIRDITRVLEGRREESLNEIEKLRAGADATPPERTNQRELANFYRTRADAAQLVGRSGQQSKDYRLAIEYGRRSYASGQMQAREYAGMLTVTADAEMEIGSAIRAKSLFQEAMAVAAKAKYPETEQLIIRILLVHYYLAYDDLQNAEHLLNQAKETWAKEQENRKYWEVVTWDELQSQLWAAEARLLSTFGKLQAGEVLYRKALENFRQHKDIPNYGKHILIPKLNLRVHLRHLYLLGNNLIRQERPLEAEIIWREMISESVKGFGRYSNVTAAATTGFARTLLEQGRFDEAATLADTTLEIWRAIEAPINSFALQKTYQLLADILVLREDWEGASDLYAYIETALADDPMAQERLLNQNPSYALTLFRSNRVERARIVLEQAYTAKRQALGYQHREAAELGALLAVMENAEGEHQQALLRFRETVPTLLSRAHRSRDDDTLGMVHEARLALVLERYIGLLAHLYARVPTSTLSQEYLSKAFELADHARGRTVQGALDKSSARAAAKDPALAQLMRREQDALKQISAMRGLLSDHLTQASDEQTPGVAENLKTTISRLSQARSALMAEIEANFPDYAELINPTAPSLAQARSVLLPDEALLAFFVGRERSFAWVVSKTGAPAFVAIELGADELGGQVDEIRLALAPNASTLGDIPPFDLGIAYELYQQLLEPVAPAWWQKKHLIIVPHRALGYLPLSVLPTKEIKLVDKSETLFSGYRKVRWLARTHSVTVLPSVGALHTLRAMPPGKPNRRAFVGFADPVFSTEQTQVVAALQVSTATASENKIGVRGVSVRLRGLVKVEKLDAMASADLSVLPPLPDTREEVNEIARALRADLNRDVFFGEAASESQVKSLDLSIYRVIAFATHGLIPGDLDGLVQPALALSSPEVVGGEEDGLLMMGEVLGLQLNADWVILSACNTGAGEGAGAEAISGLGRAFFYAGARAL
ncbi:MAG TPA: CHAT domain-containing protein, partial [Gammaproteobacteria bacterium]|nr:CHAT domain-containing protein [Gammaproteobacteria bacterium]